MRRGVYPSSGALERDGAQRKAHGTAGKGWRGGWLRRGAVGPARTPVERARRHRCTQCREGELLLQKNLRADGGTQKRDAQGQREGARDQREGR